MSLYIHQENQKLLWDSIHQYPLFQSFNNQDPQVKEQWFRSVIEKFYDNNRFKILSIKEVQQLNRETILYMIEALKQNTQRTPNVNQSPISYSNLPFETKDASRDAIMERKQTEIQSKFTLRQQEYSSMLQNGPSFEIDFSEKQQDDTPIENMENLMQNVMKQREYDLTETPKLQVIDLGKKVTFEENSNIGIFINLCLVSVDASRCYMQKSSCMLFCWNAPGRIPVLAVLLCALSEPCSPALQICLS